MDLLKNAARGFKKRLPVILLLNVFMLLIICILFAIMGTAPFSPYIKSLAAQVLSVSEVFIFLGIFAVCGFVLEYFLRNQIQDRILTLNNNWGKMAAVVIPTIICLLLHFSFGIAGIVYGLICGAALSLFYLWKQDWLTFSLWHMTWGFIIVPFSMGLCVFMDGQIRNDFLFAYKKKHIMKEKMYYQKNWGWVDSVHYRPDHFEHFLKAVESTDGQGEVEVADGWITPLKIPVYFSVKYKFEKPESEVEKWAMVTGMMMHFMRLNETVQEESPWYHGNQLSAWQFDDMSSCLLCCLDRYPGEKLVTGEEIKSIDELLKIWEQNGEEIVGIKMKEDESWNLLPGNRRNELKTLVEAQKKNWSAVEIINSND